MSPEPMDSVFAEQVARRWPDSSLDEKPDGSFVVTIPQFPLPQGVYNQERTRMWFVVPVGFPYAQPEHFWTDTNLRFTSGAFPPNLFDEPDGLHWMHRLMFWDVRKDSLINYVGSIMRRLANPIPPGSDR